jgi:hypothetical protein
MSAPGDVVSRDDVLQSIKRGSEWLKLPLAAMRAVGPAKPGQSRHRHGDRTAVGRH